MCECTCAERQSRGAARYDWLKPVIGSLFTFPLLASLVALAHEHEKPYFVDVSESTGLQFTHDNGSTGEFWLAEIMGSGVAILDFDGDGRLDLWLVQGGPFADRTTGLKNDQLYRNVSDRTGLKFDNVTTQSGVQASGYGMGIATGDIDNDGDADVLLANVGTNQLFENLGNGRFEDITARSGLTGSAWSVSASFADIDNDGLLDLYIANYVDFGIHNHRYCFSSSSRYGSPGSFGSRQLQDPRSSVGYCSPKNYQPTTDKLYRNVGGGRFDDISALAGIQGLPGPGLGVVADDFDDNGWVDFYVANDGVENALWMNQGNQTFVEDALLAGVSVNGNAAPESSMGVIASDFDQDGDTDLFLTHLMTETNTLYVNDGRGSFIDASVRTRIAHGSVNFTGFGAGWIDVNNDGDLDLFSANGAVSYIKEQVIAGVDVPMRLRNQLWVNDGNGSYAEIRAGPAFELLDVSRGASFGDLDNDGDVDIVVSNNNGPVRLYRNDTVQSHWLGLVLQGNTQFPQTVGSLVWCESNEQFRIRTRTDGSYASAHDPRVLIGLDDVATAQYVGIRWPDGTLQRFGPLEVDKYHVLQRAATQ